MSLRPDLSTLLLGFQPSGGGSICVGVVTDGPAPPRWVAELVSFLREIPAFEVRLLATGGPAAVPSRRPSWLVERLYAEARRRAAFDPFAAVPAGDVSPASSGSIAAAGCDVLIWLASRDHAIAPAALARHGVFTVRFGEGEGIVPFWEEVLHDRALSAVTIFWHDVSLTEGRAVRRAEIGTRAGLGLMLSHQEPLVAVLRMMAGLCVELRHRGEAAVTAFRVLPAQAIDGQTSPAYPGVLEAGRCLAGKFLRRAGRRWIDRGKKNRWFVALRPRSDRLDAGGFRPLPLPPGRAEMADPFLWEAGGRQYLFVETLAANSVRGRIECAEVLDNGECSPMQIVLEGDHHLSYPSLIGSAGETFLLPESGEAGRVDLYRFRRFPDEVTLASTLMEGLALVDTTAFFQDGCWYFFATTLEPYMETLLFWSRRLDGPWNLHPASPLSRSAANCRSAGNLFFRDGRLYRPTQDCSVRYGYAIQINEVLRLTPHEFEERWVRRIAPDWQAGLLGTHTMSESSRWQALDGIRMV